MYIEGTYYHPTFLYESIWDVAGFVILLTLRKHLRIGETFFSYLIWYSIGRFLLKAYVPIAMLTKSYSCGTTCFNHFDTRRFNFYCLPTFKI